jgi:hypothetical protein
MKNILILHAIVIGFLTQNSMAQEQMRFVSPQTVQYILNDTYLNVPRAELQKIISEKDLQSLENYSKLDKKQIYANAYVAAAAAGAAVAAVDYVWNKYVNSKFVNTQAPDDRYFDLVFENQSGQVNNLSLDGGYFPNAPKVAFIVAPNIGSDPVALTPVVGTAVAGAVAYNATKWGLKQAFGDPNHEVLNLDEKQFDLSYQ